MDKKEIKKLFENDQKIEIDEEGRKIIRVYVHNDDQFVSPYASNGTPVLSGETADFLNHSLKHLRFIDKIHFIIESNCIDDDEKKLYEAAIKNYYHQELIENKEQIKQKTKISIIMILLGAIIFLIAIACSNSAGTLLLDILDVIAWVFVWEAVDLFVLQRGTLKNQQLRYLQIMFSKITFQDIKLKEKN